MEVKIQSLATLDNKEQFTANMLQCNQWYKVDEFKCKRLSLE